MFALADLSPAIGLTLAFAVALVLGLALKFWLVTRQIRYVARHRAEVPARFAGRIALATHQKAPDYTIAKARLGVLEMAPGAVPLLGGLDALNQALLRVSGAGLLQHLALLLPFAAISGLIGLPLSLSRIFAL